MEKNELSADCVKPDYKRMYEEAAEQAAYWKEECQRCSYEAVYLRAVKHTAEAFLGRKIGEENERT